MVIRRTRRTTKTVKIPDDVPADQAGQTGGRRHQQQDQAAAQAEREMLKVVQTFSSIIVM